MQLLAHLWKKFKKQKKILCNLFVDRVEMRRRKVHGRWKTHANVFFRFNPKKFESDIEKGSTTKALTSAKRGSLKGKKSKDGGRCKT